MKPFTLKSHKLGGQFTPEYYYNEWGAGGNNLSPDLYWENAPEGTKAFAITMYDAAAPTGSGWWHWVIFNIPDTVQELAAGAGSTKPEALPSGAILGMTDFARPGYGGPVPIPGSGFHPYVITVHALKEPLALKADANPALVGFQMSIVTLAKASVVAYVHV